MGSSGVTQRISRTAIELNLAFSRHGQRLLTCVSNDLRSGSPVMTA